MKTLTAAALAKTNTTTGIEPYILLKVEVGGLVGNLYFSDKDVVVSGVKYYGKIKALGELSSVKNQNSGSVSSMSVTIDDTDLTFYRLIKTINLSTKRVSCYQYFDGLSSVDLIPIMVGELTTPTSWKEDRTFSFEINTKTRSLPTGFTPFDNIQLELVGKSMPLCYGTVFDIPCTMLVKPRQAKLFDDIVINDSGPYAFGSLTFRVDQNIDFPIGVIITLVLGSYKVDGYFDTVNPKLFHTVAQKVENLTYLGYVNTDPRIIIVEQTNINVTGKYIQVNQTTGGGELHSSPGNIFTEKYGVTAQRNVTDPITGVVTTQLILLNPITAPVASIDHGLNPPDVGAQIRVLASFTYAILKAGTIIFQEGFTDTVYCCNAIPSTSILGVLAYRSFQSAGALRTENDLVTLDQKYYTFSLNYSFNGQSLTVITLKQPLVYYQQGWVDDNIYVSLVSSVGSNTSDIIKDIVTRYTTYIPDLVSFGKVANQLVKYPSNFAVFDSKDALTFIGEICWQARCAYYVSANIVYLTYLSTEPSSVFDLNDNHIKPRSVELGYTKFEDTVTQLIAKYKLSYAPGEIQRQLVYNRNQDLFGLRRQTYDFYIYTDATLVQKSLTFWGNRLSNQWCQLNLTTYLKALPLDMFDAATANYLGHDNVNVVVKGIVDELSNDTLNFEIKQRYWLPILAGTNVISSLAWMDDTNDPIAIAPVAPLINQGSVVVFIDFVPQSKILNTGNSLLGIVTGINTDGTFICDIYANGYDQPPTEYSVLVNLIDTRRKHKLGDKVLVVRVGASTYDPLDATSGGGIIAQVTAISGDNYTVTLYRDGIDSTPDPEDVGVTATRPNASDYFLVNDYCIAVESGDTTYIFKSGGLAFGGDNETKIIDAANPTDTRPLLSDLFKIVDGDLCLNLDNVKLVDSTGSKCPLSDIFTILNGTLALWSNISMSDGTNVADISMSIDTSVTPNVFLPDATLLRD